MILVAIIRTRSLCGYRYLHRPSTVTQSRSRPISAIRVHMYVPHTHSLRNHLPFPHPSSYLRTYPMPRTLSIQIHHITHLFRDSNHSIVLPPPPTSGRKLPTGLTDPPTASDRALQPIMPRKDTLGLRTNYNSMFLGPITGSHMCVDPNYLILCTPDPGHVPPT